MPNSVELKDQIRKFIIETTYVPAPDVKDDTLIFEKGFFDSMGFILLINFINETFGVKTDDSELMEENFQSVNAIAGFVERKLK
ncbi:MAG TPA: acyl carrier protein [Ferruginibacter sp.]|nr:acyl carrier protein [Ferruginibacter sp.]